MVGYVALVLFGSTIPIANWLIGNVGVMCVPSGPCLVPVGFGLMAPSGVIVIGLALVLRDAVHQTLGFRWAFGAVLVGSAVSGVVAPPPLALASAVAFLTAESADLAVFSWVRKRSVSAAILVSGAVGAVVDSAVFLWIAFGTLDYLPGQFLGKLWASIAAAGFIFALGRQRRKAC